MKPCREVGQFQGGGWVSFRAAGTRTALAGPEQGIQCTCCEANGAIRTRFIGPDLLDAQRRVRSSTQLRQDLLVNRRLASHRILHRDRATIAS
jgi:hypothetical protein